MHSLFRHFQFGILASLLTVFASSALAFNDTCMNRNEVMPLNNQQVLQWKFNSGIKSGWQARANVTGIVLSVLPDHSGHDHFIIQIGPRPVQDTIEVIYSQDFGDLPTIQAGMQIHACGDFIKSTQPNGGYPASPAGAIVHWVHANTRGGGHENGYVAVDNVMYGIGPDRGARPEPRHQGGDWHNKH